ncbi:pyruvate formate lyase family protein [Kiritimatiella glycovorans]|uniref:Pyruvate formate-lyase n=1 Tax=Kiritimatiella glycovorans TaxID=1307763 RepID=A0A0G3EFV4_9BACT|nr:pyruvate formate lyase family protein [Kiritimatiella glycovorans]AKJ63695.1 Pyruvate formate-lyase [Kiritimatiella glycovorans]
MQNEQTLFEKRIIRSAIEFTRAYREHADDPKALREAHCVRTQFPALLKPIREKDLFAGIMEKASYLVKVSVQGFDETIVDGVPITEDAVDTGDPASTLGPRIQQAGYCVHSEYMTYLAQQHPEYAAELKELRAFWEQENTWRRFNEALPPELCEYPMQSILPYTLREGEGPILHIGSCRIAGMLPDYDKLLQRGLNGLADELIERGKRTQTDDEKAVIQAMLMTLDTVKSACAHYAEEARAKMKGATEKRRGELERIAGALDAVRQRKPESLFEAIQLYRLYAVMAETFDCGRMDVYLGDFYAHDIDQGVITDEDAIEMLTSLWTMIDDYTVNSGGRLALGGRGRRNEKNADRFAIVAMETTRRKRSILPTMTLRFYDGIDPAVMSKAYDVIGEGCLYPMLYNDDRCIEGVSRIMNLPMEDAVNYLPLGCGEYSLNKIGIGSPNTALNITKALEAALHNGRDALTGRRNGPETGDPGTFETFDQLYEAFREQVSCLARISARCHDIEYRIEGADCAFLLNAILSEDCIEKAAGLIEGIRYRGGCAEGFGGTPAGESLYNIRRLVYEDKKYTLPQLIAILDADYKNHEALRRELLALPKYGNDEPDVDAMVHEVNRFCNRAVAEAIEGTDLHYYIMSSVNPGGVRLGYETGASADGRRRGEAFSIGNSPLAGRDKNGITALFNSIIGTPIENGGYITNFKLSKSMFDEENRPKTEALFDAYFGDGGQQANVTVVGRRDLEDAIEHPEKYPHVLIRVGGWSARFIDLEERIQQEVLHRTLY